MSDITAAGCVVVVDFGCSIRLKAGDDLEWRQLRLGFLIRYSGSLYRFSARLLPSTRSTRLASFRSRHFAGVAKQGYANSPKHFVTLFAIGWSALPLRVPKLMSWER
jgi:hypothetical protein